MMYEYIAFIAIFIAFILVFVSINFFKRARGAIIDFLNLQSNIAILVLMIRPFFINKAGLEFLAVRMLGIFKKILKVSISYFRGG